MIICKKYRLNTRAHLSEAFIFCRPRWGLVKSSTSIITQDHVYNVLILIRMIFCKKYACINTHDHWYSISLLVIAFDSTNMGVVHTTDTHTTSNFRYKNWMLATPLFVLQTLVKSTHVLMTMITCSMYFYPSDLLKSTHIFYTLTRNFD